MLVLEPGHYMRGFEPRQISALMSLCLALHEYGFGIGLMFFGASCLVAGYLLYQSGYFPKLLGILQAIAGLCYLVNSLLLLLAPAVANMLFSRYSSSRLCWRAINRAMASGNGSEYLEVG